MLDGPPSPTTSREDELDRAQDQRRLCFLVAEAEVGSDIPLPQSHLAPEDDIGWTLQVSVTVRISPLDRIGIVDPKYL
jgi:hypothetical protein